MHTPGPWDSGTVYATGQTVPLSNRPVRVVMAPAGDIAYIFNGVGAEEQIANARLIAAAPELLEACKKALNYLGGDGQERKCNGPLGAIIQLQAAISKAEGRS